MQRIATTAFLAMVCADLCGAHELVPLGPDFVVTTRLANDQHDAWVGCDDKGNFAIVYSQGDAYVRVLDRDGTPVTDDLLVNPTISAGTQTQSHVLLDPVTGDFVVTMSDLSGNDGAGEACIGRFYQADGTPYGAEQILNVNTADSQFEPVGAFAVDGTVFLAWADADPNTDGSVGVVGRIYDRTGAPQTGEFLINEANDKTQIRPSVAASRDGLFVIAYTDASGATGQPDEIVYRLFDGNGTALGPQRAANSVSAGEQERAEVAMDADGDFVIVWEDLSGNDGSGFGVFARLFDANGDPKGAQFVVSQTTAGDQLDPHVAMDYMGNFVVSWESDAAGTGDVFLRHFDRFGAPLSDELRAHDDAADEQEDIRVAMSQSGERVIAVWHSGPYLDGDVHARLFEAPALEFSGTAALTSTVDLDLLVPGMGGSLYFILPSLLTTPPIAVNGSRSLDLGVDSLMTSAVANPESNVFSNIAGTLDPSGAAAAMITIPDNAAFYGLPIHLAAVTLEAGFGGGYGLGTSTLDGIEFLSDVRTVTVAGPVRFHPGQMIEGAIATVIDEDRASFEALKGQKVKIKVQKIVDALIPAPASRVRVEIWDDQGNFLKGLTAKPGSKKKSKLKFKSKQDGTYFLHVLGHEQITGEYEFKTSVKSKKSAKGSTSIQKIGKNGTKKKKISAVAGTTLSIEAKAKGGAPVLTSLTLRDPNGDLVTVQPFLITQGVSLLLTDVPLDLTGKYEVVLIGAPGDKYKLTLTPTPPDATGVISLE